MPQIKKLCLPNCITHADRIAVSEWLETVLGTKNYDYKWNNTTGMTLLLRKHNTELITELLLKFG